MNSQNLNPLLTMMVTMKILSKTSSTNAETDAALSIPSDGSATEKKTDGSCAKNSRTQKPWMSGWHESC
jgi:hypothetical protein